MPDFTILEPMSIGDIIDRSVRLYRRNFGSLLAVAAIPSLFGALSSTMLFYGYSEMLRSTATGSGFPPGALVMMGLGLVCYPIWGFTMLVAVSAMARVVSDHVMLGEEITFRKCLSAVRRRLGDITIMGLLVFGITVAITFIIWMVAFIAMIAIVILAGIVAALGLPGWLSGIALVIGVIAGVAVAVVCGLAIVSRFLFLPQVVMIEGESAGSALGRAMRLGAKNWYRVGAIVLFTYFVFGSLLAALTLPLLAVLGFGGGFFTPEFFLQPGWSALYTGFDQISRLLVLPIWIVSFTLLYFDSRVRKEGYDIEVLIRAFQPEAQAKDFYWRPVAQPPPVRYEAPPPVWDRRYVQTSPLGLGGYRLPQRTPAPDGESPGPHGEARETSVLRQAGQTSDLQQDPNQCKKCGAALEPAARFCHHCGQDVSDTR
ncbi:MAG TPA: zinc ribbon domain-containing protein [Blastocatellia bacterium]|nr:zinc ribbon domain-containing protein [Blastocatellia bacterium]